MTMSLEALAAWRDHVAPHLSDAGLLALADALRSDDIRLMQGGTCWPPPNDAYRDWPCEQGCAITLAAWLGDGKVTVGEAWDAYAAVRERAVESVAEFTRWFDDTPRIKMLPAMLAEVEAVIDARKAVPA